MAITWPTNTRTVIDLIRAAIGRLITVFVTVTGVACPVCSLDPVTNLSTDPFCSTCDGEYWLDTTSGWDVLAHVRWKYGEQPLRVAGGVIEEGDCIVTIAHSGSALDNVEGSHHFVVDGKSMYMKHYGLRGVPQPNRIRVTLLEDKG